MGIAAESKSELTRLRIFDALLALAKDKPLAEVTVTELCRRAHVSRMTFYRNYATKEEVLLSRLDQLIDQYEERTAEFLAAGELWYGKGHICICFTYFKEHRDFISCLYDSGYAGYFVSKVAEYMISKFWNGTAEQRYVIAGFAGVLCATYELWATNGFPETPDQLASIVSDNYTPRVGTRA